MKARSKKSDHWETYVRRLTRRRKSRRWETFSEVTFSGQATHALLDLQDELLEVAEQTFELWWRIEHIRCAAQKLLPPLDHDVDLSPQLPRRRKTDKES